MAKLFSVLVASALLLAPLSARAGLLFEGSVGSGVTLSPHAGDRIPTNVMLTGGYSFTMLKLELGVVGNLTDVENSKFDLDLRPMLVIKPPLFPVYGRAILGVSGLVEGPSSLTYGGALGVRIGAIGLGGFVEAGALSKRIKVDDKDKDSWLAEGRIGVYWD
jgi:hypothetical protein